MRQRWRGGVLALPLLGWLVSGAYGQGTVDISQPFTELGTPIWHVVVPGAIGILAAFGLWLSIRAGHLGLFLGVVGALMLIYFTGALPTFIQAAGLDWPF